MSTCTLYFISSSPLSSQQIICILNLLNFPNFLLVMFSIFSVSFPCDLRRLLLFPIFFFLPVDCTIDNCQVFYFFNFFPLSSNQISCNLLVFPSYLSCFLFSQFLSSVISADYSCCIERHCCENCKCSSDLLWHLNFLSPDYFVFRILSLCEVFHIFKTHILGIMQNFFTCCAWQTQQRPIIDNSNFERL